MIGASVRSFAVRAGLLLSLAAGSCMADTISFFNVDTGGIFLFRDTNTETFDVEVLPGTTVSVIDSITGPFGNLVAAEAGTDVYLTANIGLTELGAIILDYSSRTVTDTNITLLGLGTPITGITDPALARATGGLNLFDFGLFAVDSQTGLVTYSLTTWQSTITDSTVPEPATVGLMGAGLILFGVARKQWRRVGRKG